jgi:anti-sigma factor RsiW
MNPEKLFDYLEGNVSETERAQLEARIAADPQLQRELEIAREMHRRSRGSREVMLEGDEPELPSPPKPLGRRVATAFAALVLLNVLIGIAFIIGKKGDSGERRALEAATRKQVAESLQKSAETSLPLPSIGDDIYLPAVVGERERVAESVIVLATQAGGSAAKAPPDDQRITVIVDLPSTRADEFRRSLAPLAPADYSPPPPDPSAAPDKQAIMQVRIGEPMPSPTP